MNKFVIGQVTALMVISGAASAALPPVVNANGQVVSNQATSSATVQMYNRLQQLQLEVQQLRGQVEEQTYLIESLKKRQRDLYLDTDRRIQLLEQKAAGVQPALSSEPVNTTTTDGGLSPAANNSVETAPSTGSGDTLAYEKAFSSIKSGRNKQAIEQFSSFVETFPNSSLMPNALYWLGEASYVNRDFERANTEFNKVVTDFPDHSKAKDALLKIGFIQYENKQWQEARKTLSTVSKKYHGSTVARLADQRLDRMRQEKR